MSSPLGHILSISSVSTLSDLAPFPCILLYIHIFSPLSYLLLSFPTILFSALPLAILPLTLLFCFLFFLLLLFPPFLNLPFIPYVSCLTSYSFLLFPTLFAFT